MLVSVIIPVYNVKPYISRCMDSVLAQTYQNLEIILVDDGSTDGSGEICDAYAERDKSVKVIHKKNGGYVSAKKKGLETVSGEYIGYVDPDDWIDPDMYQNMAKAAEENDADFVACGYIVEEDGKRPVKIPNIISSGCYFGADLLKAVYQRMFCSNYGQYFDGINSSGCCKLIRKNLLIKYQNQVDDRLVLHNDVAHVYPCALEAKRICILENCYYHYWMRSDSIMHTPRTDEPLQIKLLRSSLQEPFAKGDPTGILSAQLEQFLTQWAMNDIVAQYGIKIGKIYRFPFEEIDKGSEIVIWGAGAVGQAYFNQAFPYCHVALWVDSAYATIYRKNPQVSPPESIMKLPTFKKIVIAVNNESNAESIRDELALMGIRTDKIFWCKPRVIGQGFMLLTSLKS